MTKLAVAHSVAVAHDVVSLTLGGYRARIGGVQDISRKALSLRAQSFRNGAADDDRFDVDSLHGIVESEPGDVCVAFRVRLFRTASDLPNTYTGQFYDLSRLVLHPGPFLELGRVCQTEKAPDIMALRLAWAALGALVDANDVRLIIGCSSLPGAQPDRHKGALATLRANHLGPRAMRPGRKASATIDLPDTGADVSALPDLLRSYLNMGAWVSDHAVQDTQLDTLHVFTGLDIDAIPDARKRRLRALAHAARVTPLDLAPAAP